MADLMPAAFLGHGSPMNTLSRNRYTEAWRAFGDSMPRPRAVLAVSAHWYINASAVTAMAMPRTIHDFYGFPQELFDVRYPAPGAPEIAREIAEVVGMPPNIGLDEDSWGLDHGTWSVLVHVFPKADIPVLQLSINATQPLSYHLDLGARLAPLRQRGILILGSGNVVHNLRRIDWAHEDAAFDWNRRFDGHVKDVMTRQPADLVHVERHPDFSLSAPTAEHFVPLLYIAGLAVAAGQKADVIVEGPSMGSLSMTSYRLGSGEGGRESPPTGDLRADQSNI
jgi:4,5-DOPA dioxygenase extradiol